MKYPENQHGKHRPQSKEWQDIRAELMQLKTQFKLTNDEFRPLSPTENHQAIEKQFIQTFCTVKDGKVGDGWLWQYFKQEEFSAYDLPERPECYLSQLIENINNVGGVLNVIDLRVYNKVGGDYSLNEIAQPMVPYSTTRQIDVSDTYTLYGDPISIFEIRNPDKDVRVRVMS